MKKPKTLAESPWGQSWIELVVLYVLSAVGGSLLFQLHWMTSMLAAPLIMGGLLIAVMILVHSLWVVVIGLEKVGEAIGFRKTPLA